MDVRPLLAANVCARLLPYFKGVSSCPLVIAMAVDFMSNDLQAAKNLLLRYGGKLPWPLAGSTAVSLKAVQHIVSRMGVAVEIESLPQEGLCTCCSTPVTVFADPSCLPE